MNPDNKNEILELLAEGKITATEAVELLAGMKTDAPQESTFPEMKANEASGETDDAIAVEEFKSNVSKPAADPFQIKITEDDLSPSKKNVESPRWLKIRVRDLDTGRNKVNISLPLGIVGFGLGLARRFGSDFDDEYNVYEMWQMVKEGERGVLVDVEDEDDNEHVQIYID